MGGARGAGRGVANPSSGVHRGEGMIFSHLQRSLQDTRSHSLLFIFGFFDCAGKNGRKKNPFLSGVAELESGRHSPGHHAGSGDFASERLLSRVPTPERSTT